MEHLTGQRIKKASRGLHFETIQCHPMGRTPQEVSPCLKEKDADSVTTPWACCCYAYVSPVQRIACKHMERLDELVAHFTHWFSTYVMKTQKPAHKMTESSSYAARQSPSKSLHWLHRQEKPKRTHAVLHLETQQTQTVHGPERLSSQLSGRKRTWTGTEGNGCPDRV